MHLRRLTARRRARREVEVDDPLVVERPHLEHVAHPLGVRLVGRALGHDGDEVDERTRCQAFFDESETVAEGLEGLVWALINTKEFRLIH